MPIEFFAYSDIDMAGVFGGNEADSDSTGDRHRIVHASCPDEMAEFWGESPWDWEVAAWPNLADSLVANPFAGLANATLPFGPADYTGCMSWRGDVGLGGGLKLPGKGGTL